MRKSMIKYELKRAMLDRKCQALLAFGLLIAITHFCMYSMSFVKANELLEKYSVHMHMVAPSSVYEGWIGSGTYSLQSYLYYIILPLLVAGSFADSFFVEKKSGYLKSILIRRRIEDYLKDKLISVFIVGGLVFVIPLLVDFALVATALPVHVPQLIASQSAIRGLTFLGNLYYSVPMLYLGIYMVIDFVYAGLVACLSMLLAFYAEHRFFIYGAPFVIWMFIHSVCGLIGIEEWSPVYFLNPGYGGNKGFVILTYFLLMIIGTVIIVHINMKRDVM